MNESAVDADVDAVIKEAGSAMPVIQVVSQGPAAVPETPRGHPSMPVEVSPAALSRPCNTASCLPGFMQPETLARHLPMLAGLPAETVASIQERLGAAAELEPVSNAGAPSFTRVTESRVLALLEEVVQRSTPARPDNLVGYEWVEIAPLIAGRLATEGAPLPESMPETLDAAGVARVCLFSYGKLPAAKVSPGGAAQITVPAIAEIVAVGHQPLTVNQDGVEHVLLVAQFMVRPVVQPIRLLVVEGRTVALSGLARLVALRSRGVERALCAVSYGYGHDTFLALPTIDESLLGAARPPLIQDFADSRVAVTIPVRAEMTHMAITAQTLRG